MDKKKDNEIARDIIAGKITELYCIKTGYDTKYLYPIGTQVPPNQSNNYHNSRFIFGKKYKLHVSSYPVYYLNSEVDRNYTIQIQDEFFKYYELAKDTNISDYFAISLKAVRKDKLNKIKNVRL